jgi:hypothetical protein
LPSLEVVEPSSWPMAVVRSPQGSKKKKIEGVWPPQGQKKKKKKKKKIVDRMGGQNNENEQVGVWPPLDRPKRKWLNHPMTLGDGSATSKSQIPYHCFEGTSVPQNSVAELPHE